MQSSIIQGFIDAAARNQWTLRTKSDKILFLNSNFTLRYPKIPDQYLAFLENIAECASPDGTSWFLCEDHFNGSSPYQSCWNEFEILERNTVEDKNSQENITKFWNMHLPFALSVKSDFAYVGFSLEENSFGKVVHSFAPYFMEADIICESFEEFLLLLTNVVSNNTVNIDENMLWKIRDFV